MNDFQDKSKIQYEQPSFSDLRRKTKENFVHNTVQNKNKSNDDHLRHIHTNHNLNKRNIVQSFHELGIEQRVLNKLKNGLFESPLIINNKFLPIDEWYRIKQ